MTVKIQSYAHHRNGVCGTPFWVVLFSTTGIDKPSTGKHMQAIIFPRPRGEIACAITDLEQSLAGNIAFASGNSWRGDNFYDELVAALPADVRSDILCQQQPIPSPDDSYRRPPMTNEQHEDATTDYFNGLSEDDPS